MSLPQTTEKSSECAARRTEPDDLVRDGFPVVSPGWTPASHVERPPTFAHLPLAAWLALPPADPWCKQFGVQRGQPIDLGTEDFGGRWRDDLKLGSGLFR